MNLVELQRALRQLRLSGMAAGLEPRLLQAQTDTLAPIAFLSPLVDELAEAQLAGARKQFLPQVTPVPLLVLDDLGMKRLPHTAAEDLLEIVMRRYERASTLITSNRPVEDWGKLLGDTAAVTALLDRLLHHPHVLTCGPRSWRTPLHGARGTSGA